MNWTERQIHFIIQDMIEENPLACRGLFQLSEIKFTDKVDTMAVDISLSPVLHINLNFCRQHLHNENDMKAVLLHEFLHVLLLHTEKYTTSSFLLNICLDAIINAIIYRNQGMEYAGFFARFYKWEKLSFLLRPQCEEKPLEKEWMDIHKRIYQGKYCADDLYELLDYLRSKMNITEVEKVILLGNHENNGATISDEVNKVLVDILSKMAGVKIWNKEKSQSYGSKINKEIIEIERYSQHIWNTATIKVLKKCMLQDDIKKRGLVDQEITSPVLMGGDKRNLSRFIWSGLIPFSTYSSLQYGHCPTEKVQIYLDVSGSMKQEINRLVNLLFHFRKFIKKPFLVFSDDVKEAFFVGDQLEYDTSNGTRIDPVFNHIRENKITRALIVTDGYVNEINEAILHGIDRSKIQVLLSAEGNPKEFEKTGIPYTRLEAINQKKELNK